MHSAVEAAGAACLDASNRGSGHLAKTGGAWASIIAAAAAKQLHGAVATSAGDFFPPPAPAATAGDVPW